MLAYFHRKPENKQIKISFVQENCTQLFGKMASEKVINGLLDSFVTRRDHGGISWLLLDFCVFLGNIYSSYYNLFGFYCFWLVSKVIQRLYAFLFIGKAGTTQNKFIVIGMHSKDMWYLVHPLRYYHTSIIVLTF